MAFVVPLVSERACYLVCISTLWHLLLTTLETVGFHPTRSKVPPIHSSVLGNKSHIVAGL